MRVCFMFVDTHCHLDSIVLYGSNELVLDSEKVDSIGKIVGDAHDSGVKCIVNVGCDIKSSKNSIELARKFDSVYAVVGAHPYEAKSGWKDEFEQIKKVVERSTPEDKIVGIGEIGLDYSRKHFNKTTQADYLKAQIELAIEHNLPVSFHVRDAADDFLRIVEPYVGEISRAVIHCFQQDKHFADIVTKKWGWYVGIDGPITYPKNEQLREVVCDIGIEHVVLETDSPFLPVQQERGAINYPSRIPVIALKVAELVGLSLNEVATITTKNAVNLFGLSFLT